MGWLIRSALFVSVGVVWLGQLPSAQPLPPDQKPGARVDRKECVRCHAGVKEHAVIHGPVKADACYSCHKILSAEQHTFVPPEDNCARCHQKISLDRSVVHEPVTSGACVSCHDPHGGESKAMLAASPPALCLECHADVQRGTAPVHGRGARCTDCHESHAADHAALLVRPREALCLECHEPIREALAGAVSHTPVNDARGCLNCHTTHSSEHRSLLVRPADALCMDCHDRTLETAEGSTVANVKAELDGATHLHAPVEEGCTSCHESHGGDGFRLLNAAYPDQLYTDFSEEAYALCFGCHDLELATAATTATATGFRDGRRNLHRVHLDKRRTCRICHDAHAGSNDRLVRASVPYGRAGYNLVIGWEPSASGGSCARNCHVATTYERDASE